MEGQKTEKPGKPEKSRNSEKPENPEKHGYFPLFIDLTGRKVLVAGAGTVGMRRAGVLAQFGADVWLVAPRMTGELPDGGKGEMPELHLPGIVWLRRRFEPKDISGCFLVVAATDDEALNARIVRLCRERGIYVNHAGDQTQCDFYFPAVAMEGSLVVGVTSSGKDHGLVRRLSARLRMWLKQELAN